MSAETRTPRRCDADLSQSRANPVRDVSPIRSKTGPKGAKALTADELRGLLGKLLASEYCQKNDVVDPIIIFMATGLRISELLGLRWQDFDERAATLAVTGKLVRAACKGLERIDETKTTAGRRTIPLPRFAVETLQRRRGRPYLGEQEMIFPSTAGTWRDPDNFRARWRKVRDELRPESRRRRREERGSRPAEWCKSRGRSA
jgi:integrase